MKVGYQGVPGSYSETTLQQYMHMQQHEHFTPIGYNHFEEIIHDVAQQTLDIAVIPVENSTTGLIARSVDYFRYQPIEVIAQHYLPVQHILWGLPGSSLETLTHVYSHPEALSQCQRFFNQYTHIQPQAYSDTAKSARFVAEEGNQHFGAIASLRAGQLAGLTPLQTHLQTEKNNTTRFFVIAPKTCQTMTTNQRSTHGFFYLETEHKPGALLDLLKVFDLFKCNLEGLNARPIHDKPFQYGFFIEVDFTHLTVSFDVLWQTLQAHSTYVQSLGIYSSAITSYIEE